MASLFLKFCHSFDELAIGLCVALILSVIILIMNMLNSCLVVVPFC